MLNNFINFLYLVAFYPLILWIIRCKPLRFLDSSRFLVNIEVNSNQKSPESQRLSARNDPRHRISHRSNTTSSCNCSNFITNPTTSSVKLNKKRASCNSADITKFQSFVNITSDCLSLRHCPRISEFHKHSPSVNTVPISLSSSPSSRTVGVYVVRFLESVNCKLKRVDVKLKQTIEWIKFYSSFNFCDKFHNFLEFSNKRSQTSVTNVESKHAVNWLTEQKQMEFSDGIAEINKHQSLQIHTFQFQFAWPFESSKWWSGLKFKQYLFVQLGKLWRGSRLFVFVTCTCEILCGRDRTSNYFRFTDSNKTKYYRNLLNGACLFSQWWWNSWKNLVSRGLCDGDEIRSDNEYDGPHQRQAKHQPQQLQQHQLEQQRYRKHQKRNNEHECQKRMLGLPIKALRSIFLIAFITSVPHLSASFHHNIKYSMNVVKTKYGPLRGVVVRSNPTVEAFLGVPYASPPVGSLRYMPPVTPSTWRNTRLADRFSAVCPQVAPVAPSGPEALLEVPRGRLAQLRRLLPLLANQSEDCLYLNLYVPRTQYPTPPPSPAASSSSGTTGFGGATGSSNTGFGPSSSSDSNHNIPNDAPGDKPIPAILYIHGESYEWNSGNPYDGSVLAAHGNVIVVTINFRLGVLGFLKTGGKGSAQGNFGLMDLVAGLHWLRENLPAFGGDPNKVTVMGHGTGAALANVLIVSPVASDLVHRGILISGSALSPWAIQKDPLFIKRRVAEQTGCHGDLLLDDLAPCLRTKSISELLAVKVDSPRFLPGFAPFIDGTVIVHPSGGAAGPLTLPTGSAIASTSGIELADFPNRELIFGLTTIESYLDLSAQDLEFGFNETRRDRILRTYVRNIYHYHLNEIYAALKNEYTDWERPVRNPMGSRDASLEFLSDGHTAAPLIRLGYLHSLRGGRSYFLHFRHQSGERDFPQRGGSVRGEDVPFCLGLPISPLFPHNYTKQDIKISRILLRYLTNFVQTGNPNENPTASVDISHIVHNSKSPLMSASLSLAASTLPRFSPPSMSLVKISTADSAEAKVSSSASSEEPQNLSLSTSSSSSFSSLSEPMSTSRVSSTRPYSSSSRAQSSSAIQSPVTSQHQLASSLLANQSSSVSTTSISTSSVLSASSTSSVISSVSVSSSSLISFPGTPSIPPVALYKDRLLASSLPSISFPSPSYHVSTSKDATVFIAPPVHTVIKSKRHAVAAHRRKRKTSKRLPIFQKKHSTKKTNSYRKKFLTGSRVDGDTHGDRVNGNFGTSSLSFLADERVVDRRISRGVDPDEDSLENEEDDDENEAQNSEEEHADPDEDDDGENETNRNSLSNNKNDDDDNNSKDSDDDIDEHGDGEKFDRFGNADFHSPLRLPFWDTYDAINQLYLELGNRVEVKNHYRGHKLSMWLSLIPQLHSPGDLSELPMRHHHFMEDSAQYYDGIIRPQIMQRPSFPKAPVQQQSSSGGSSNRASQSGGTQPKTTTTTIPKTDHPGFNAGIPATTECPPNTTIVPTIAATRPQNHQQNGNTQGGSRGSSPGDSANKQDNNLFRRLASSQFQSYTTALTVTISVGCFLLLLNILIFAGIYYQREKRATDAKKKELLREAENLCASTTNIEKLSASESSFPGGGGGGKGSRKSSLQSLTAFNAGGSFGEYSCYDEKIQCKEKHPLADICSVELPLKEFKCSGSPVQSNTGSLCRQQGQSNSASNPSSSSILMYPPSYHHPPQSTPHKTLHRYSSPDRQSCSNSSDLVTYQQFQKPAVHQHFHHSHQGHQAHNSHGSGATSSATVATSTEHCNQSTQSEQPKVQDVATSIDERAVSGGDSNSDRGSSIGGGAGGSSSTGGTSNTGTSSSINDADNMISPGIPEPPPPPKSTVPYQGGILRNTPTTPSSNKKRVQIQEISV